MPLALALTVALTAADLTPAAETQVLLAERRLLTAEKPSLAAPIVFLAAGAAGWAVSLVSLAILGAVELQWSFNGFPRLQPFVNDCLMAAGISAASALVLAAIGGTFLGFRIKDRIAVDHRVEEIDLALAGRVAP